MVIDGIVIGIIVGLIRAGFKNGFMALSNVRIKGGLIFPLLLLLQFVMFYYQDRFELLDQISGSFFMVIYVVGLYVLWLNRNEPGFWYIFIGVGLNFLVMVLNGGRMPVSLEAAKVLDPVYIEMLKNGVTVTKHVMLSESTHLAFLGDIIPIAPPYPRTQVISIGDIVMNIGIFIYLQKIMLIEKHRTSTLEAQ